MSIMCTVQRVCLLVDVERACTCIVLCLQVSVGVYRNSWRAGRKEGGREGGREGVKEGGREGGGGGWEERERAGGGLKEGGRGSREWGKECVLPMDNTIPLKLVIIFTSNYCGNTIWCDTESCVDIVFNIITTHTTDCHSVPILWHACLYCGTVCLYCGTVCLYCDTACHFKETSNNICTRSSHISVCVHHFRNYFTLPTPLDNC